MADGNNCIKTKVLCFFVTMVLDMDDRMKAEQ